MAGAATLAATVLVPTTGDRGPLLPLSVGSILTQNVRDIEVFIMGDGVNEATRAAIADLIRQDSRVRFFDHPKDQRRGEIHRHAALAEARGRIVCYLTDRDLMLPNHVEVMSRTLKDADFGHSLRFEITPSGSVEFSAVVDINDEQERERAVHRSPEIPLSFAAHTLDMYQRLPHGWRTTPPGNYTDLYMWQQFLAEPDCRTATSTEPTILYFKRGDHPGLSTMERLTELRRWHEKMAIPGWQAEFSEFVRDAAIRDRARLARREKRSKSRRLFDRLRRAFR